MYEQIEITNNFMAVDKMINCLTLISDALLNSNEGIDNYLGL